MNVNEKYTHVHERKLGVQCEFKLLEVFAKMNLNQH